MSGVCLNVPRPDGVPVDAFEAIVNADLWRIRARMANEHGLSEEYLDAVEREWKKYLLLLVQQPGVRFPMGDPVDRFAHEHMADTRAFRALCQAIGPDCVIHHQPTIDEDEKTALLPDYHRLTIPAMERLFGEADPAFWPRNRCVCTYDNEVTH